MLVIELTDEKFGKAMHNISCMEDKLAELKKMFELEVSSDTEHIEDEEYKEYLKEHKPKEYIRKYM